MNNVQKYEKKFFLDVIITTRNSSSYIHNALNALCSQTNKNFNVIIIDDASQDNVELKTIVNRYSSLLNIHLICLDIKSNASRTRNLGLDFSKNNYISFHDADDIWFNNKVEVIYKSIENIPPEQPCIIFHPVLHINEKDVYNTTENSSYAKKYSFNKNIIDYLINNNGVIQTSAITITKSTSELIKFNENLQRHQDVQYCIDAYIKKIPFIFIDKILSFWVILSENPSVIKKGATSDFCFNWLKYNDMNFTFFNRINYIGKTLLPISYKENKLIDSVIKVKNNFNLATVFFSFLILIKSLLNVYMKRIRKILKLEKKKKKNNN